MESMRQSWGRAVLVPVILLAATSAGCGSGGDPSVGASATSGRRPATTTTSSTATSTTTATTSTTMPPPPTTPPPATTPPTTPPPPPTAAEPVPGPEGPCGQVTSAIGTPVVVAVVQGSVACPEALAVVTRYYTDDSLVVEGSGAFADFDGWTCSSPSPDNAEAYGYVGSCERGDDLIRMLDP